MKGQFNSTIKANNFAIPYMNEHKNFVTQIYLRCHKEFGFMVSLKSREFIQKYFSSTQTIPNHLREAYDRMFAHSKHPTYNEDTVNIFIYAVQLRHNLFLNKDFNNVEVDHLYDIAYRYDEYYMDDIPYIDDDIGINKYGNIIILGVGLVCPFKNNMIIPISSDMETELDMESLYNDFINKLRLPLNRKVFMICDDDAPFSSIFGTMKKFKQISKFYNSNN